LLYDKASRRTSVTDAAGNVTSFGYDANGNQTSITDARTNTTSFHYDKDNRRTAVVYPDQTSDQMAYDSLGRMTSKTDQAGKSTQSASILLAGSPALSMPLTTSLNMAMTSSERKSRKPMRWAGLLLSNMTKSAAE
jgi:YD repeat-containing protein